MMRRSHLHLIALGAMLWLGAPSGPDAASARQGGARRAQTPTVDALAARFVQAIHRNDLAAALQLVPTLEELRRAGLGRHATPQRYEQFLAKRRRGFARVVAKHRRKHPGGCKRLVLSRVKKGALRQRGPLRAYDSIDVFAKCDGREIWLGDPDGIFRTASGWRMMEFR